MFYLEKARILILIMILAHVIAAGGTMAPILPFALPVCTLAVECLALNTARSLPQTVITTTTTTKPDPLPSVQKSTTTTWLPKPESELSHGTLEKMRRRESASSSTGVAYGDQSSDCLGGRVWVYQSGPLLFLSHPPPPKSNGFSSD